MRQVALGDIVILKQGLSQIAAVGEVVEREGRHRGEGDKPWLRDFDGWDLAAYCYVDWRVPETAVRTAGLTRATIQQVHQSEHQQIADLILQGRIRAHHPEPSTTNPVSDDQILRFLIREGLRSADADDLTTTLRRIRLLSEYYRDHCDWDQIREHETRTYLVVPLLLALGWSEQQMKIEFPCSKGRVDIACFSRPYRGKNDKCLVLVETKDFSSGLDFAASQARSYATDFPACEVLVVTNGYSYKTFTRVAGEFARSPVAYLNLMAPRDRYPVDPVNVGGALDVLKWLLPSSFA